MEPEPELAILALFDNKEELLPLWLRLREALDRLGPDVRVRPRESYAEFDRVGEEFLIAEPTSHHRLELGLHNPGLPFTARFREAPEFGSRRITPGSPCPSRTTSTLTCSRATLTGTICTA